uniref:Uncharacterized protein n=1 Tax=Anopheles atroparvus TaxID=41427 RepID=A0AAG5CND6_ANOAO
MRQSNPLRGSWSCRGQLDLKVVTDSRRRTVTVRCASGAAGWRNRHGAYVGRWSSRIGVRSQRLVSDRFSNRRIRPDTRRTACFVVQPFVGVFCDVQILDRFVVGVRFAAGKRLVIARYPAETVGRRDGGIGVVVLIVTD